MSVDNDLAELKGIGPKYAEMLKSIGVDSIKELSGPRPKFLGGYQAAASAAG
jgi:Domain of unknown function (DUF4332)